MNARIAELEAMIVRAYAQRKQAYKLRCPKFVTTDINNQIFSLTTELANLKKVAA